MLVLSALLGKHEAAVLVLLLEHERLDLIAKRNEVGRIGILANRELADRDDALGLEADINKDLVLLDLNHSTADEIALIEVDILLSDEVVHLLGANVI